MALSSLFSAYAVDNRRPSLIIALPACDYFWPPGSALGVVPPLAGVWMLAFPLLLGQFALHAAIAWVVYHHILVVRGRLNTKDTSISKLSASIGRSSPQRQQHLKLLFLGVIIPLLLIFPWMMARWLQLNNVALIMAIGGVSPILVSLRLVAAVHGTLPPYALDRPYYFVLYVASGILTFVFDPESRQPLLWTWYWMRCQVSNLIRQVVEGTILISVLYHYHYRPFSEVYTGGLVDSFRPAHLANSFLMAHLTAFLLDTGSLGVCILASLCTGFATLTLNDRPLSKSTSPSDFWSRRWNRVVHATLKQGVYQPCRQYGITRAGAALFTFLGSGLLHEYVLLCIADRKSHSYRARHGKQLGFFIWNGILLVLENTLGQHPVVSMIRKYLPDQIRTALVILMVLPVGHLFTDEYVACGFYGNISMGFPRLDWIPTSR